MENLRVVVRKAKASDAGAIAGFNRAIALETENLRLEGSTVRAGVDAVLADESRGLYRVAEMDGEVVGQMLITLEWSDWRNRWFWWIQSVYTAPEARGKGVFRALYDAVESEARERGDVCGLRLYVEKENETAQKAYAKMGMKRSHYVFFAREF